jgi:hypothetical protein
VDENQVGKKRRARRTVKEVERLVEEFIRRNEALGVLSDETYTPLPSGFHVSRNPLLPVCAESQPHGGGVSHHSVTDQAHTVAEIRLGPSSSDDFTTNGPPK